MDRREILKKAVEGLILTSTGTVAFAAVNANQQVPGNLNSVNSSGVTFNPLGAGTIATTVQEKLQQVVSVLDFGADPSGKTDSSSAFNNAFATRKEVYVPAGTYAVNATASGMFILRGDGATVSIIRPYNTALSAITYTSHAPYWTYHSEVRGIGFVGTSQVGVGFTFSKTIPTNYAIGDEFAGNVKFYGCRFSGLNKGVQFPFGNIGSEFYSCGFNGNYYGVYCLDTKFGGLMHAGNKYFFGGEFDGNKCGVYFHNVTDGFGGVAFYGTIIENNNIGVYCYTSNTFVPISLNDVWLEANGAFVSASTVNLDVWSKSTATPTAFSPHALIFDGANSSYNFNGGAFTDCHLKATHSRVIACNSRVEVTPAYAGHPFQVDDAQSQIYLDKPQTSGGVGCYARTIVKGYVKPVQYTFVALNQGRQFLSGHRYNKSSGAFGGSGFVLNFTSSVSLTGSLNSVVGTVVSDGVIYTSCNSFTIPFTARNQYMGINSTTLTTTAGWYVATVDLKLIAGTPYFFLWDRASTQFIDFATVPENNIWYTLCAIGYSAGRESLAFDVGTSSAVTAIVHMSAYQIHRFDTEHEAQAFLESSVYIGP